MALQHPFITGRHFDPSFTPIPAVQNDPSKSVAPQYVIFLHLI